MRRRLSALAGLAVTVGLVQPASAISIDLNDFFNDPTVAVTGDGSSASFAEDPGFFSVLLANDPGLGDLNVIIPGDGPLLSFDFDFSEAAGEDDEFGVFVLDAATGLSEGAAFEFFTSTTNVGTVSFDLSSLAGKTLGLQFQLTSGFADTGFGSTLVVSNVQLTPTPSAVVLGLIGLGAVRRMRRRAGAA